MHPLGFPGRVPCFLQPTPDTRRAGRTIRPRGPVKRSARCLHRSAAWPQVMCVLGIPLRPIPAALRHGTPSPESNDVLSIERYTEPRCADAARPTS